MKFSFLTALILCCCCLFAQGPTQVNSPDVDNTLLTQRSVNLHVMPFSFATRLPRARIGAQLISGRWGYLLDLEYGNKTTLGIVKPNRDKNARFIGLRPEIRYLFPEGNGNNAYLGVEMPVSVFQKDFQGVFRTDESGQLGVSFARQERLRISAVFKAGIQLSAGDHWLYDFYVGAGVGYRKLNYNDRVNPRPINRPSDDEYCTIICDLADVRSGIVPELAFGLRVGYSLSVR